MCMHHKRPSATSVFLSLAALAVLMSLGVTTQFSLSDFFCEIRRHHNVDENTFWKRQFYS